jgi:hypothetical protein
LRRGRSLLLLASTLIGIGTADRADAGSPIAGGYDALDRVALAVDGSSRATVPTR